MIAIRKRYPVFGRGQIEFLHPTNLAVLAYSAGQTRKGDLAAQKAVQKSPAADRPSVKSQLDALKKQGGASTGSAPHRHRDLAGQDEGTARQRDSLLAAEGCGVVDRRRAAVRS